jgi:hypothetical protein
MNAKVELLFGSTYSEFYLELLKTKPRTLFMRNLKQERYLSLIAWDKVCKPCDGGGLNNRDLEKVNEALILKLVWHVATGSDRLWVSIMRVKYCGHSDIWAPLCGEQLWNSRGAQEGSDVGIR